MFLAEVKLFKICSNWG